jgi:hypothetical protein
MVKGSVLGSVSDWAQVLVSESEWVKEWALE